LSKVKCAKYVVLIITFSIILLVNVPFTANVLLVVGTFFFNHIFFSIFSSVMTVYIVEQVIA